MKKDDHTWLHFQKNKANLSASSREAIANALKAVDRSKAAKQLVAFGIVGITMDTYDLFASLQTAIKTNNWRPFFVKAESMCWPKKLVFSLHGYSVLRLVHH
ncbi:colicin-like pore-forming protein [Lelliottia amnigena]|uniref:colicin-like pore-forming protein n=1 Tax=Lelliottia amnigena TaxID=61646 RepID=UPI0021D8331E|nr:colicin-like pore-forming protein [Lelliottia amnigena]MCU7782277.1 colicin-like pore-forming protein [Lelliottia amnigena]